MVMFMESGHLYKQIISFEWLSSKEIHRSLIAYTNLRLSEKLLVHSIRNP
jgi:hypothetical protein